MPGLSLVEMLVVLAVASILCASALPSFGELLRGHAMTAASSQWMASLQRARAEAMRRGVPVTVVAAETGGWNAGWTLFRDENGNRALDRDEEVLYAYGPIAETLNVKLNFAGKPMQFHPNGRPLQSGHVLLTLGPMRRKVIVNMLGRSRVCNPDQPAGSC